MKTKFIIATLIFLAATSANGQICSPKGNQTKYGTGDVWIGYVYRDMDFNSYRGYVTEGTPGNANFDEDFGGSYVNYSVNNCSVYTESFSVRYKLKKTFANGSYDITVGGDDGYRLSIDGGATWVIDRWTDQPYTTTTATIQLNGTYNLVLEYYENSGNNRISFNYVTSCTGSENTSIYGTGNQWNGYVYSGVNFNTYRGMVTEGNSSNPDFDQNFGGNYTTFSTSSCTNVSTEYFSVRYRLTKNFSNARYTFFLGGDDGYRLSLDGGSTWVIDQWNIQSYNVSSYTTVLSGSYNMVIEYYENSGVNRISFALDQISVLPIKLLSFEANEKNNTVVVDWKTAVGSNPDFYEIERSADGVAFYSIATINGDAAANAQSDISLSFTDKTPINGKSYYRLKMADETGVISYSTIATIIVNNGTAAANMVSVFPTIVSNNRISLRPEKTIKETIVTLFNTAGSVISKNKFGKIQAGQVISFNLSSATLSRGVYFIQVSQQDQPLTTQKIIIQ